MRAETIRLGIILDLVFLLSIAAFYPINLVFLIMVLIVVFYAFSNPSA